MANFLHNLSRSRTGIDIPPVMVIGLGRFGISLARELTANGVEVLGVDVDAKLVREQSQFLTDAVIADGTDPQALDQLGVSEMECVVLAIGTHLEASILTASNLVEAGVKDIWAKADSEAHGRILTQLGVPHVIHPERDTGRRVAHLLGGRFREFAEIAPDYSVTSLAPPPFLTSSPVRLAEAWRTKGVQIIAVRSTDGSFTPLVDGTLLAPTDTIIAGGSPTALEAFTR
ncbi:potassium channel family protein [Corynebacterium glaucum]|uniref:potassium channel family protein n=1 Tax=Corynebacterium glaucum TaxID=187491 RepID=UPI0026588EF2|nr:TrkA family potassium uptake protein [Corynebacterium glaucum]